MKETRAYLIYPEYFDKNLPRSKGRKVPLSKCVKNPKLRELELAAKKLGLSVQVQKRNHHPANWFRQRGRLFIPNARVSATKRTVIKKIAKVLPAARKILAREKAQKRLKEKRKRKDTEKYLEKVLKGK
ncbi:MAG: hypothetical protein GWO20_11455 [Candidatus Korarchaeota archaeon]|nr:hypothetical protein [Candidatus Korarchaeota archaeon]NIU83912.1 hypothetical protein [Candidatus Thorarchaeota archaeon]NIW14203.1 hypothetical protein [Candidatus Thorarchaeota archaeon]NIW52302.1 hypothetical protein [Candidatus Korarchaeota archaeon]